MFGTYWCRCVPRPSCHLTSLQTSYLQQWRRRAFHAAIVARQQIEQRKLNERIRAARVQLITDLGDNKGVVTLDEALSAFDKEVFDLVQVGTKVVDGEPVPITRIMARTARIQAERERERAFTEPKKIAKKAQPKQLFITTACGDNDLKVKFNKIVELLKKGVPVEVQLHQKTQNAPTVQAAAQKWPQLFAGHPSLKGIAAVDKKAKVADAKTSYRQTKTPAGDKKAVVYVEDGIEKSMFIWRWTLNPVVSK